MKKSVYTYSAQGSNFSVDLEILLDLNREFNDIDLANMGKNVKNIIDSLHEESIKLDPESTKRSKKEKDEIISLFGARSIFVEEISNGYCSNYCCKHLPWFIVTTSNGRIKIGWRKRVISIDWTDSVIKEDSETLFPDEDTTKYDKVIHAWSLEKAKEYIDILLV